MIARLKYLSGRVRRVELPFSREPEFLRLSEPPGTSPRSFARTDDYYQGVRIYREVEL